MFKVLSIGGKGAFTVARAGTAAAATAGATAAKFAAHEGVEGIGMAAKGGGKVLGKVIQEVGSIRMPDILPHEEKKKKKNWFSLGANIDSDTRTDDTVLDASDDEIDPLGAFKAHILEHDSCDDDFLDRLFLKAQPHLGIPVGQTFEAANHNRTLEEMARRLQKGLRA